MIPGTYLTVDPLPKNSIQEFVRFLLELAAKTKAV